MPTKYSAGFFKFKHNRKKKDSAIPTTGMTNSMFDNLWLPMTDLSEESIQHLWAMFSTSLELAWYAGCAYVPEQAPTHFNFVEDAMLCGVFATLITFRNLYKSTIALNQEKKALNQQLTKLTKIDQTKRDKYNKLTELKINNLNKQLTLIKFEERFLITKSSLALASAGFYFGSEFLPALHAVAQVAGPLYVAGALAHIAYSWYQYEKAVAKAELVELEYAEFCLGLIDTHRELFDGKTSNDIASAEEAIKLVDEKLKNNGFNSKDNFTKAGFKANLYDRFKQHQAARVDARKEVSVAQKRLGLALLSLATLTVWAFCPPALLGCVVMLSAIAVTSLCLEQQHARSKQKANKRVEDYNNNPHTPPPEAETKGVNFVRSA